MRIECAFDAHPCLHVKGPFSLIQLQQSEKIKDYYRGLVQCMGLASVYNEIHMAEVPIDNEAQFESGQRLLIRL